MRRQQVELHGKPVTYSQLGDGPPVVLVHGICSSSRTWRSVIPALAERHTVVAPDLIGHGRSAKPRGDYSPGAYASGIRDLLVMLELPRATVVGHSLGGGIAMQFAYLFPERLERLVLVDSGGLGNEVSPFLRAATLPGAEFVMPLLFTRASRSAGRAVHRLIRRFRPPPSGDVRGITEGLDSLADPGARRAFIHTARSVLDPRGQRVDARDRLYLARDVPTLLVWGEEDPLIPVEHAHIAHELMPNSRLEVFQGAGHFPFEDDPDRFARVVTDFVARTEPAELDEAQIESLLRSE